MIKKLKGQGAIEYLLILGAVLVVAAIVVMLVLNFSSKGLEQLQASCAQAIDKSIAYKRASALNYYDVDSVKGVCAPCYDLDKYYLEKKGIKADVDFDEIMKSPIFFVDFATVSTNNNKYIRIDHFPNYLVCLTTTKYGKSNTFLLATLIGTTGGSGSTGGSGTGGGGSGGTSYVLLGKLEINNSNNKSLNGYQIRVNVSALVSSYGYNFSIIDNNANYLNYCFEQPNGECNQTPSDIIWLKTKTLYMGTTDLYIIKNNKRVGLTDGKNVFDFYDDFKTLDTSLWKIYGDALAKIKITNPTSNTYKKYKFKINISRLRKKYGNIKFSIGKFASLPYCYEQPDGSCNQNPTDIIWVWNVSQDTSSAWTHLYIAPGDNWLYFWRSSYSGTSFNIQAYSAPDMTSYVDNNLKLVNNVPFAKNGVLYLSNKTGYFGANIRLKNKILEGKNELLFIKYYLSGHLFKDDETDWWFNYPEDYAGHWFQTFEDESGKWIRTKSWDKNPDWKFWLPSNSALRDGWTAISIGRIGKKIYLSYYKPWNKKYRDAIILYTGSTNIENLFTKSGLIIGTCCGNFRTLKFDFIYARKYIENEPTVTLYVY